MSAENFLSLAINKKPYTYIFTYYLFIGLNKSELVVKKNMYGKCAF